MLRNCIIVLSNSFFNEFFQGVAKVCVDSEQAANAVQTYQQRVFVDDDIFNYRSDSSDYHFVFGLGDCDGFTDECGICFTDVIDEDGHAFSDLSAFSDTLEYLHGLFVTKGINSIVTVYFHDSYDLFPTKFSPLSD